MASVVRNAPAINTRNERGVNKSGEERGGAGEGSDERAQKEKKKKWSDLGEDGNNCDNRNKTMKQVVVKKEN